MNAPLIEAFPRKFAPELIQLAPVIDPQTGLATSKFFTIICDAETIQIPQRIYRPVISEGVFASLSPQDKLIAACWFTRHHDGNVRERFLRTLSAFDRSWIVAYVVPLCGEYVAELLHYIWEHRSLFDRDVLGGWLRENQAFHARTRSRIVSYWDCYYRSEYPQFSTYVGSQLIVFFDECAAIRAL